MPVVFSTHWYNSGFGYRTLSAHKLSSAFDLPLRLQHSGEAACNDWLTSESFSKMHQLSLFNVTMDTVLDALGAVDLGVAPTVEGVSHHPMPLGRQFRCFVAFDWALLIAFMGRCLFDHRKVGQG